MFVYFETNDRMSKYVLLTPRALSDWLLNSCSWTDFLYDQNIKTKIYFFHCGKIHIM